MIKYLALGDSYTIGEQVPQEENFPNQAVSILRKRYFIDLEPPVIIAQTGWTTDELMAAIEERSPEDKYDLVTLLIGVNNQYRGRSLEEYEGAFARLLVKAISLAGSRSERVFVLSIPDWALTPFAKEKDVKKISAEIDAFNKVCKSIALAYQCHYLDITDSSRKHANDALFLTSDQLHYSGAEYKIWAKNLAGPMSTALNEGNAN